MGAEIAAIEYHLPSEILSTAELATLFPEWPADKIAEKTGILERRIAAEDEFAIDLAYGAAKKLFGSGACSPEEINLLLLCTQTPERSIPAGACVLQDRLGLSTSVGAFDFNMGCSGYVYGLGIAHGYIASGQAKTVLLLTADTVSKLLAPQDKALRTILGDGAAATLVREKGGAKLGPFVYGTDGAGASHLTAGCGGLRSHQNPDRVEHLFMDGPEVFSFAIRVVPKAIHELLSRDGSSMEDVDLFVFHQANLHILEHLRKKLRVSEDRFVVALRNVGNTSASSLAIALKQAVSEGRLRPGALVLLAGFGGGLSWSATLLRWQSSFYR